MIYKLFLSSTGVEVKLKNMHYPVIIAVTHIPELNEITKIENGIKFGSSVTLTDIDHTLKTYIDQLPGMYTQRIKLIT